MVGEASERMQKADCRDEIALPAAMLAWLKYRKQRTRNSRKRFLVFFCSLFVKARVVYRLRSSLLIWIAIAAVVAGLGGFITAREVRKRKDRD